MATVSADAYFHASSRSVIRGFHVYKAACMDSNSTVNAEHSTQQEYDTEDLYAVAVIILKERSLKFLTSYTLSAHG